MQEITRAIVIIFNFDKKKDVIECLDSVSRLSCPAYKTLVVDSASTDSSQEAIQEAYPEIPLIRNPNHQTCMRLDGL